VGGTGAQHTPSAKLGYNGNVPAYITIPKKPEPARRGWLPASNGVRFHITMKTSTTESTV